MGRRVQVYTQVELVRALDVFAQRMYAVSFKRGYLGYRFLSTASRMEVHNVLNIPYYKEPPVSGDWIDTSGGDNLPNPVNLGEPVVTGYATNRLFAIASAWNEVSEMMENGDPSVRWTRAQQRGMEVAWATARALHSGIVNGLGGKQPDGLFTVLEAAAEGSQTGTVHGLPKATYSFVRNRFEQLTKNAGYMAPGSQIPALVQAIINLIAATSRGASAPTDIVTYKAVFDVLRKCFMEMSSPWHMIADKDIVANIGIENFTIDGLKVAWDSYIPTNRLGVFKFSQRLDAERRLGIQLAGEIADLALEQNIAQDLIDTDSPPLALIYNPNIQNRRLSPRSMGPKSSVMSEWTMTTANVAYIRPNELGVLADDASGAKMERYA